MHAFHVIIIFNTFMTKRCCCDCSVVTCKTPAGLCRTVLSVLSE